MMKRTLCILAGAAAIVGAAAILLVGPLPEPREVLCSAAAFVVGCMLIASSI